MATSEIPDLEPLHDPTPVTGFQIGRAVRDDGVEEVAVTFRLPEDELSPTYILPDPHDAAALASGISETVRRVISDPQIPL